MPNWGKQYILTKEGLAKWNNSQAKQGYNDIHEFIYGNVNNNQWVKEASPKEWSDFDQVYGDATLSPAGPTQADLEYANRRSQRKQQELQRKRANNPNYGKAEVIFKGRNESPDLMPYRPPPQIQRGLYDEVKPDNFKPAAKFAANLPLSQQNSIANTMNRDEKG